MNYASFWIRSLAHLIDFVLINAIGLAIEYGLAGAVFLFRKFILGDEIAFDQSLNPLFEQAFSVAVGLAITYYYYVSYQLKQGTTLGKKVFSLTVVDAETGLAMTQKQATLRMVSYLPSYLIFGCGFLMAAFHPQRRALHDLIAGTVCVKGNSLK